MEADNAPTLRFYSTAEIAEMLKMNVQVIARKLQYGELTGYKIGKDWRVREEDLLQWLEKHSNQSTLLPGQKVIGRFMKNGRFEALPAQDKRRRYILDYILSHFELGRVYTEKEVNQIIMRFHDDYCRVRREFIGWGMMSRKDGKYMRHVSYVPLK